MTFFTSDDTPLYSTAWSPRTTGQYAGTCIFLIFLALALRGLIALKSVLEMHVWRSSMAVGHVHGRADPGPDQGSESSEEAKVPRVPVTQEGLLRTVRMHARPWRLNVDGSRAVLDLLIVGVAYLL